MTMSLSLSICVWCVCVCLPLPLSLSLSLCLSVCLCACVFPSLSREALPYSFLEHSDEDLAQADLVIVIGTSLRVSPVSYLPARSGENVKRLFINRESLMGLLVPLCFSLFARVSLCPPSPAIGEWALQTAASAASGTPPMWSSWETCKKKFWSWSACAAGRFDPSSLRLVHLPGREAPQATRAAAVAHAPDPSPVPRSVQAR